MTDETRTSITAGEAAKLVGKSTPTITRAIKSGRLSAKPRKPRGWIIEPSVLFSVFPPVTEVTNDNSKILELEAAVQYSVLQAKLEALEQRFNDAQATIGDLRNRLDTESVERRRLTAQITDQRNKTEPPDKGVLARIGAIFTG